MKKTIQTNVGGTAFYLDIDAHQVYTEYIASLKDHYKQEENSEEIIHDIEQRIAEIFNSYLSPSKQAITVKDVQNMMIKMGNVEDLNEPKTESESTTDDSAGRKFYRNLDESYIGGVAAGLGSYFSIDPIIFRILFIVLFFFNGLGLILYVILWAIVPAARNLSEKMRMKGDPMNLSGINKNINEEYQRVKSNIKNYRQSENFSKIQDGLESILLLIVNIIKYAFKIVGTVLIFGLMLVCIGGMIWLISHFVFNWHFPHIHIDPEYWGITDWFQHSEKSGLLIFLLLLIVFIPVLALIIGLFKAILNSQTKHRVLGALATTTWILALIFFCIIILYEKDTFISGAKQTNSYPLNNKHHKSVYVDLNSIEDEFRGLTVYSFFNFNFYYTKHEERFYGKPSLEILYTDENTPTLEITKTAQFVFDYNEYDEYVDEIDYDWKMVDSVLFLDGFYSVDMDDKWKLGKTNLKLYLPEDYKITLCDEITEILDKEQSLKFYASSQTYIMTYGGLKRLEH